METTIQQPERAVAVISCLRLDEVLQSEIGNYATDIGHAPLALSLLHVVYDTHTKLEYTACCLLALQQVLMECLVAETKLFVDREAYNKTSDVLNVTEGNGQLIRWLGHLNQLLRYAATVIKNTEALEAA